MTEEIEFECQACGKSFPADPDTMVELNLGPVRVPIGEDREDYEEVTPEQLEAMDDEELAAYGLDSASRDALLRGENVPVGGVCLCKECQEEMRRCS